MLTYKNNNNAKIVIFCATTYDGLGGNSLRWHLAPAPDGVAEAAGVKRRAVAPNAVCHGRKCSVPECDGASLALARQEEDTLRRQVKHLGLPVEEDGASVVLRPGRPIRDHATAALKWRKRPAAEAFMDPSPAAPC